jgi:hypothetical protein
LRHPQLACASTGIGAAAVPRRPGALGPGARAGSPGWFEGASFFIRFKCSPFFFNGTPAWSYRYLHRKPAKQRQDHMRGASKKKEKENKHKKKNLAKSDRPTFFFFF